jgi:hypothetical protein
MRAMFEFFIRVLKWLPRPLVPLVPIVVTLLGPLPLILLIVYSIHAPHGDEASSWGSKARNGNEVASSPPSASGSQATALERPISTTMSKMSAQPVK